MRLAPKYQNKEIRLKYVDLFIGLAAVSLDKTSHQKEDISEEEAALLEFEKMNLKFTELTKNILNPTPAPPLHATPVTSTHFQEGLRQFKLNDFAKAS